MREINGRMIKPLGLGCWAIGGPFWQDDVSLGWGKVSEREAQRGIKLAIDAGIQFIDTADLYGAGHSEQVIAKAIKGQREKLLISTKFGFEFDERNKQVLGVNLSPAYIQTACLRSIKRLQCGYIDVYHLHVNDLPPNQIAEVIATLEQLREYGLIKSFAWSTDSLRCAEAMAQYPGCSAIQHTLNVLNPAPDISRLCQQKNILSINRSPLAMGLLTGKYGLDKSTALIGRDDIRSSDLAWLDYFKSGVANKALLKKLAGVRDILQSGGRSLAQGALAWIWAQSEQSLPIPGFKTEAQVLENIKALEFGPLTPAQVEEIEQLMKFPSYTTVARACV